MFPSLSASGLVESCHGTERPWPIQQEEEKEGQRKERKGEERKGKWEERERRKGKREKEEVNPFRL